MRVRSNRGGATSEGFTHVHLSSEPKETRAASADTAAQAIPSDICREADDVPHNTWKM